jgi:hypothetical protein
LPLFAAMAKSNKRKSYDLSLIKDFSKTKLVILAICKGLTFRYLYFSCIEGFDCKCRTARTSKPSGFVRRIKDCPSMPVPFRWTRKEP